MKQIETSKKAEYSVAIGSFLAAVGLAFTSLIISEEHDIASGVLMMCAQFLMLTATIFGIDYKFQTHDNYIRRQEQLNAKKDDV